MSNDRASQLKTSEIHGWHVYVISEEGREFSKIGSACRPQYRIDSIRNGNPRKLEIIKTWHLNSREIARRVEREAILSMPSRVKNRDWIAGSPEDAISAVEAAISKIPSPFFDGGKWKLNFASKSTEPNKGNQRHD